MNFQLKLIITCYFLAGLFLHTNATTYYPVKSKFNSINEWKNPGNWRVNNWEPNTGYPQGTDQITFSWNSNIRTLEINFDLDTISDQLTLYPALGGTSLFLEIGTLGNAQLSFKESSSSIFTIKTHENSYLKIKSDLTFGQPGANNYDLLDISGTVDLEGTLKGTNSKQVIQIRKQGILNVKKHTLHTNNELKFIVCGILNIDGNLATDQGLKIELCDGGQINVGGDMEYSCTGESWIIGDGSVSVGGSCKVCPNNNNICDDVDLPVELIYFKGQINPQGNLLIWETASEFNASHFDVEVSSDRKNWHVLGTVNAAGNSTVPIKYQFLDKNSFGKYYRLAQYDFDERIEYYGVVSFTDKDDLFSAKVYPTEVFSNKELKVEVSNANVAYPIVGVLYNQNGVVLDHEIILNEPEQFNSAIYTTPNELTTGVYILMISNGRNSESTKLLVR
ncbi:hypothetical protein [Flammeovirga pacifica]|uniref:Secretion system C-terminal sorting domain-containing protein n=1 Tax=Flammeovirga pacifica TaxID=915059 RepID=A0A1S1YTE5_FLAPC|nr:hypothetical protein [Flammeovirga pacifica]OHX64302.1 hypothetical protein NH26_22155 [Flammeovirga pacifica]